MNILQICAVYAPAWGFGGPPRVMLDLAKQLVAHGHSVTVYTTDAGDDQGRVAARARSFDGVQVHYFPNPSNTLAWRYKSIFLFPVGMSKALDKSIRGFDVLHIAGVRNVPALLAYRAARRHGVPYCVSPFGVLPSATGIRGLYRKAWDQLFVRSLVKYALRLGAQTRHEADMCLEFGARKEQVQILPLGIDLTDFKRLPERGMFRSKLGLGERELVVLFLGRFHETKGIDVLISAFSRISPRFPNAKLVIAGRPDGNYEATLRELVARSTCRERIILAGPQYGIDRIRAYRDADVFALTSTFYEETSLASLEACACGVPAVLTYQCDMPGLVASGGGIVVASEPNEVSDALELLLADSVRRKQMGEKARRFVWQTYSWQAIFDEYEKFLKCT